MFEDTFLLDAPPFISCEDFEGEKQRPWLVCLARFILTLGVFFVTVRIKLHLLEAASHNNMYIALIIAYL